MGDFFMTLETLTDSSPAATESATSTARPIPPLETGDHLTRREFERRYNAMPSLKKAELIEGVVYVPSPVRFKITVRRIYKWLPGLVSILATPLA
jgi:hypothetical protein